jgi:hypothetical protein
MKQIQISTLISFETSSVLRDEVWIRFLFFLDRIYRINGMFFPCGEMSSAEGRLILTILLILVCQAKPGQSCELKGVHLVSCPFDK